MGAFYSSFLIEVWPLLVAVATAKALILQLLPMTNGKPPCLPTLGTRKSFGLGGWRRRESETGGGKGSWAPTKTPCLAGTLESRACFEPLNQPYSECPCVYRWARSLLFNSQHSPREKRLGVSFYRMSMAPKGDQRLLLPRPQGSGERTVCLP